MFLICLQLLHKNLILGDFSFLKISSFLIPAQKQHLVLSWSLTWKYFGPLHHADHLLSSQAVEAGQQVVGCVRLRVVVAGVHLLRFDQLQHAADGGRQKRCDHAGPVGHQGAGSAGIQLLLWGEVAASSATCGDLAIFGALQVLADSLQL